MQIKIQSGVGQKALEFTYKLSDLALCRVKEPINPESKSPSADRFAWGVAVKTLHVETQTARGHLHTICVCRETHSLAFVGQ